MRKRRLVVTCCSLIVSLGAWGVALGEPVVVAKIGPTKSCQLIEWEANRTPSPDECKQNREVPTPNLRKAPSGSSQDLRKLAPARLLEAFCNSIPAPGVIVPGSDLAMNSRYGSFVDAAAAHCPVHEVVGKPERSM